MGCLPGGAASGPLWTLQTKKWIPGYLQLLTQSDSALKTRNIIKLKTIFESSTPRDSETSDLISRIMYGTQMDPVQFGAACPKLETSPSHQKDRYQQLTTIGHCPNNHCILGTVTNIPTVAPTVVPPAKIRSET